MNYFPCFENDKKLQAITCYQANTNVQYIKLNPSIEGGALSITPTHLSNVEFNEDKYKILAALHYEFHLFVFVSQEVKVA